MTQKLRLPFEIQALIIEQVASGIPHGLGWEQDLSSQSALAKLALVCKDWKSVTIPLLYSKPLATDFRFYFFLETIRERPELGKHVRALRRGDDDDEDWLPSELELLPNLKSLEVLYPSARDATLPDPSLPRLTSLTVSINGDALAHVDNLLGPLILRHAPQLHSFALFEVSRQNMLELPFPSWLAAALAPTLETLHISGGLDLRHTFDTLTSVGPFASLRELKIGGPTDDLEEYDAEVSRALDEEAVYRLAKALQEVDVKELFPRMKRVTMYAARFKPQEEGNWDDGTWLVGAYVATAYAKLIEMGWEVVDATGVKWEDAWVKWEDAWVRAR